MCVLLVNVCPPTVVIAAPFHSKIPNSLASVSNHHAPSAGAPPGAVALASNSAKSISALTTYARFETPNDE